MPLISSLGPGPRIGTIKRMPGGPWNAFRARNACVKVGTRAWSLALDHVASAPRAQCLCAGRRAGARMEVLC